MGADQKTISTCLLCDWHLIAQRLGADCIMREQRCIDALRTKAVGQGVQKRRDAFEREVERYSVWCRSASTLGMEGWLRGGGTGGVVV